MSGPQIVGALNAMFDEEMRARGKFKKGVVGFVSPLIKAFLQIRQYICVTWVSSKIAEFVRIFLQVIELVTWRFSHQSIGRSNF